MDWKSENRSAVLSRYPSCNVDRHDEHATYCFDHGSGDRCQRTHSGEPGLQLFQLAARTEGWTTRDALGASGLCEWKRTAIRKWGPPVVPVPRPDRQGAIHVRWPRVLTRARRPLR